jgi:pyridoxal phosphate enzyme (YggS family)
MTESIVQSVDRTDELAKALAALQERLSRAAEIVGRNVAEIELLPVTKFFPATDVAILLGLGCRSFAESRDQEAREKARQLTEMAASADVHWHMVGRIQRNKARSIAHWADTVHSVSSARVADALDRAADEARANGVRRAPLDVYVQVSLDGDMARGGVDVEKPDEVDALCARVHAAAGLRLVGLMGIPPLGVDPEDAFIRLNAERNRVQDQYEQRLGLSAGMTADLEAAVKHGSTCVRVGTALMGARPLTSP